MKERLREAMRRLSSMINRVVLSRVDNAHKNQKWLVRGVEEQDKEIEVFELYGITSIPRVDETAELLRFSLEGYEDHTVALGATAGSFRPTDANSGEVILYTHWDKSQRHRITLSENGDNIRIQVGDTSLTVSRNGVQIVGDLSVNGQTNIYGDLYVHGHTYVSKTVQSRRYGYSVPI